MFLKNLVISLQCDRWRQSWQLSWFTDKKFYRQYLPANTTALIIRRTNCFIVWILAKLFLSTIRVRPFGWRVKWRRKFGETQKGIRVKHGTWYLNGYFQKYYVQKRIPRYKGLKENFRNLQITKCCSSLSLLYHIPSQHNSWQSFTHLRHTI